MNRGTRPPPAGALLNRSAAVTIGGLLVLACGGGLVLAAGAPLLWVGLSGVSDALCTGCHASSKWNLAVLVNLFGFIGSTALGLKSKNWKVGTKGKKTYDISTPSTPEEQQAEAWDAYQDLIMIKDAQERSPGGDLNAAMDRIKSFGKLDLGGPPQ
jgi:hypothetical protein